MKYLLLGLVISFLMFPMAAKAELSTTVPDVTLKGVVADLDTISSMEANFALYNASDAETKFKEARYMLQQGDMYVAYNKDKEVVEIGLFACY